MKTRYMHVCYFIVVAGIIFLAFAESVLAYSFKVNGIGDGNVTVDVWCNPNAPPAAPSATAFVAGFFASASIPGMAPNGAPLPAACNPATNISSTNKMFWRNTSSGAAAGGDSIGGSLDLYPLVTPVSPLSTIYLDIYGEKITDYEVKFTGWWSGSDAGAAQRLQWYDDTRMIYEIRNVGYFNEKIDVTLSGLSDYRKLVLLGDGIATSLVPEPSTILLLVFGLAGFIVFYLKESLKKKLLDI